MCFLAGTYLRWDHLALFAGCIPVPFLIMMWFVPETPRWYVSRGESLKRVLDRLQCDVDMS